MIASIPIEEKKAQDLPNREYRRMVNLKIKKMGKLLSEGKTPEKVARLCNVPLKTVKEVFKL